MIPFKEALATLSRHRGEAIVVPTMMSGREWPNHSTREVLDLPLSSCMGKASSLGLGVALARPERTVIVLDGDGSVLMNLGSLVTIANARPKNLVHIVCENGVYEVTGGQPVPGEGRFHLPTVARGTGFPRVFEFDELATWEAQVEDVLSGEGPTFVVLHVGPRGHRGPPHPRKTYHAFRELREHLTGLPTRGLA